MSYNLTELFLSAGDPAATRVLLSSLHGLWGGHEVTVSANGAIRVKLVDRTQQATYHELGPDPEAVAAVFESLTVNDFVALAHASAGQLKSVVPDTALTTITLTNGAGQTEALRFGEHDALPTGLAAIRNVLLTLRDRA